MILLVSNFGQNISVSHNRGGLSTSRVQRMWKIVVTWLLEPIDFPVKTYDLV